MTDSHVHLERGDYTAGWLDRFVSRAVETGVGEVWFLEHSYLFPEFLPMYDCLKGKSGFVDDWLARKGGKRSLAEYLGFALESRRRELPVKVRFGLEVCYFPGCEDIVRSHSEGFDFLVGSIHFIDGFAFDHIPELWEGVDVDEAYRRYFELSIQLAKCQVFDGIAHPDSIKLFGHRPSFPLERYYDRLASALAEADMYAEQNSGISRRTGAEAGMAPGLLSAMKRHGVKLVYASDAHRPEDVGALLI